MVRGTLVVGFLIVGACKPGAPSRGVERDAASTPAPSVASSSKPSASARVPATVASLPSAWLACGTDADCVALAGACCESWPSNVASREDVRKALATADSARDDCVDRMCALRVESAACDHGRCVIR